MAKKGFFDSLFILIILVLLTFRTTYVSNKNILNTYEEVNQRMIIVDQIVVDALSDKTYEKCSVSNENEYQELIELYLKEFENIYWKNKSSINCEYIFTDYTFVDDSFLMDIYLSCSSNNSHNSTIIKKEMFLIKSIEAVEYKDEESGLVLCNVLITDVNTGVEQINLFEEIK